MDHMFNTVDLSVKDAYNLLTVSQLPGITSCSPILSSFGMRKPKNIEISKLLIFQSK